MATSRPPTERSRAKGRNAVVFAAAVGALMEWYDFFIAVAAAATVWPVIFFSSMNPLLAFAFSIFAYAITFITRPLGGLIFGHVGDKSGRKSTLILTLVVMGASMVGITILPPYSVIGIAAPILLNTLRAIQGIGLGGEWGGASSWVLEVTSTSKHRGFWTGWVGFVVLFGGALAEAVFVGTSLLFPPRVFLDFGWRIPFAIGVVVLFIGLMVRYFTQESPIFENMRRDTGVAKSPAVEALRRFPKRIITGGLSVYYVFYTFSGITALYSMQYLTPRIGVVLATVSVIAGALSSCAMILVGSCLSDVLGRRKLMIIGPTLTLIVTYPYFQLLVTANVVYVMLAQIMLNGAFGVGYGAVPSALAEQFETKFRYSGSGLSYQFASLFAGIVVGFVLPGVLVTFAGSQLIFGMAALTMIVAATAIMAAFCLRETVNVEVK